MRSSPHAGFPPAFRPTQLALTRRTYAGGQAPPFLRLPVPIQVIEDPAGTAGTFDQQDAIVFYAQSFTERAYPSEYRQRFGDADFVYLGVDPAGGGARMVTAAADLGLPAPVKPLSFPSYRKYEKRFYFNYLPQDTCASILSWNDQYLDLTFTDSLTMWTPDVDPAGTVRFRGTWQGNTYNPSQHTIWARWKRPSDGLLTSVATMTWSYKTVQVADTTFAADRIASGPTGSTGAVTPTSRATRKAAARGLAAVLRGHLCAPLPRVPEPARPQQRRRPGRRRDRGRRLHGRDGASGDLLRRHRFDRPAGNPGDRAAERRLLGRAHPGPGGPRHAPPLLRAPVAARDPGCRGRPGDAGLRDADLGPAGNARHRDRHARGVPRRGRPPGRPPPLAGIRRAGRAARRDLERVRRGRRSDWAIRRLFAYAFDNWDSRFAVLLGDGSDDDRGETSNPAVRGCPST
jgi:hypothetical protein